MFAQSYLDCFGQHPGVSVGETVSCQTNVTLWSEIFGLNCIRTTTITIYSCSTAPLRLCSGCPDKFVKVTQRC